MFKALLAEKNEDGEISVGIQELNDGDLPEGEVLIDVELSLIHI